jgi:competence protein ComEA
MNTLTIYSSSTPSKKFTSSAKKAKTKAKIKSSSSVVASIVFLASTIGTFTSLNSHAQPLNITQESREINTKTTSNNSSNDVASKLGDTADMSYEKLIIDLNTSSLDELLTLKGIGQKKAEAIVAYRDKFGGFSTIDELSNIKGIGEKIIKDNIQRLKI